MTARSDTWMPLYIGDYLADTMHLNGAEHGAYVLLIMHYWRNGPLPDDDKTLAAIARTERKQWVSEIGPVVREFFHCEGAQLRHKRIDAEIARAERNSSKRRDAANARWQQEQCKEDANASSPHCKTDDPRGREPSPSPSPSERKKDSLASLAPRARGNAPRQGEIADAAFERWYLAYPRKIGKGAARRAYRAALQKTTAETLQAAVGSAAWDGDPRFIPHPATWLNGERWLDQPSPAGKPVNGHNRRREAINALFGTLDTGPGPEPSLTLMPEEYSVR